MKTVIILFVFILGARPRKPFQSQLFELSLRQRIGSMVSRTRLNLRRLYFSLCLFSHFFSNFFIQLHTILRIIDVFHWVYKPFIFKIFFQISKLFAREGKQFTPFTSLVAKLKEIKCPSKSTESLKSRWKVFIPFSVYMTIDLGTSSAVASCLVWLNFFLPFSGPCSQDFLAFMPLQEFVVHFKTGKNLWLTLQNAFVRFSLFKRCQWFC